MNKKWSCTNCARLLGIVSHDKVQIKHKDTEYRVFGSDSVTVQATCPRCQRLNEISISAKRESPKSK